MLHTHKNKSLNFSYTSQNAQRKKKYISLLQKEGKISKQLMFFFWESTFKLIINGENSCESVNQTSISTNKEITKQFINQNGYEKLLEEWIFGVLFYSILKKCPIWLLLCESSNGIILMQLHQSIEYQRPYFKPKLCVRASFYAFQ